MHFIRNEAKGFLSSYRGSTQLYHCCPSVKTLGYCQGRVDRGTLQDHGAASSRALKRWAIQMASIAENSPLFQLWLNFARDVEGV
jgi:hypothetical protein